MAKRKVLIVLFLFSFNCLPLQLASQNKNWPVELKGGIRIQKAQKLYWENGVSFDYSSQRMLDNRLHFGVSYVTTRLGSAMGSNAIKQDNFLVSTGYYFRHKKQLQPFTRLNLGYFHADYESAIFDVLPNKAFLLSLDAGISYEFKFPLTINLSAGYNFNAGTGSAGPGTLFPVFYQMSIYYTILKQQ
jgi:hypothetical protein